MSKKSPKDKKSLSKEPKGGDFEKAVVNILSVLGYKVVRNKLIRGCQIDLYAEYPTGVITLRLMVECKDYGNKRTVGIDEMAKFAGSVSTARNNGLVDKGLLVTTNGFTANAKEHACHAGIDSTTFSELSTQLVNFDKYIDQLINSYKSSHVAKSYIEISGTETEDYEDNPNVIFHRPIEKFIQIALYKKDHTKLAILGNFGTGKSTFCRSFAASMAQKYKQDKISRIPIVINLKEYDSRFNIQHLILHTLQCNYGVNISPALSYELQRIGKLMLIFDGFDEMDSKANMETIRENLRELNKVSEIRENKFILTCRTHFFRNRVQVEILEDFDILYIPEWGEVELKEYLQKKFDNKWQVYLKRISGTHNLPELAKTPIFLEMIVETLPKLGDEVKRIELYQEYTDTWIKHQTKRKNALLNQQDRKRFVKILALKLYTEDKAACHFKELLDVLRQYLVGRQDDERDERFEIDNPTQMDYLRNDVQTCTFLVRDGDGNYSFRHKSFMEFFVAQAIAEEVRSGMHSLLEQSILPLDIRNFLVDFLKDDTPTEILLNWVKEIETPTLKNNLLSLISLLKIKLPEPVTQKKPAVTGNEDLIVTFMQGDVEAFKKIYSLYYVEIQRYVLKILPSNEDVGQEIVADAFIKLWEKRSQLENVSHIRNFLYVIARNLVSNYLRSDRRRRHVHREIDSISEMAYEPDLSIHSMEAFQAISKALDKLSPKEKEVINLNIQKGLSSKEIAERLDLKIQTVRDLRVRAIKKIRISLKDSDDQSNQLSL